MFKQPVSPVSCSTHFTTPRNPVVRFAAGVGDGENPKRFFPYDVGDVVGENSEVDPAVVAGAKAVEFGVTGNP